MNRVRQNAWPCRDAPRQITADTSARRWIQALAVYVGHFLSEGPSARIDLTSQISRHHDLGYFTRSMIAADGSNAIRNHDYVHFNLDEKLMLIAGLFGDPEPL